MSNLIAGAMSPQLPLGLSEAARTRLQEIARSEPRASYLQTDDKGAWSDVRDLTAARFTQNPPMFVTTSWRAPDPDNVEAMMHLADGVWLDIDAKGDNAIYMAVNNLCLTQSKIEALGINPLSCSLFASGCKGFHVFIPMALFVQDGLRNVGPVTARYWPQICKEFVKTNLRVNCTDMDIYSGSTGRLFRQAGVLRANGAYKVPLGWSEWQRLDADTYRVLCSEPRPVKEVLAVSGHAPKACQAWIEAFKRVTRPPAPAKPAKGTRLDSHGGLVMSDRLKIERALHTLQEVDLDYGDWVRVGAALKSTGSRDALPMWVEFSRTYPGYKKGECEGKWGGLGGKGHNGKTITIGTLFALAKQFSRKGGAL